MNQIPYRDPAADHPSLVRSIVQFILALLLGVLAIVIS